MPRFEELTPEKLGTAGVVREIAFGTTRERMLVLEGCKSDKACTIFCRGGNKMVLEEAKRSMHDALCVARNLVRDPKIIYGGGSAEVSASIAVHKAAETELTVEQYTMRAFADALDEIPLALAENSGLNPIGTVAGLKARQIAENNPRLGVDCVDAGTSRMDKQLVVDTLEGKIRAYLLATSLCSHILKVDELVDLRPQQQPGQ